MISDPPPDDDATIRLPAEPEPEPAPPPEAPQPTGDAAALPQSEPPLTAGWYRPDLESTPASQRPKIDLDEAGMPHLRRVPERDPGATRVQRNATKLSPQKAPQKAAPPPPEPPYYTEATRPAHIKPPRSARDWGGCLWRVFIYGLMAFFLLIVVTMGAAGYGYWYFAHDLPSVADLEQRASKFETTRIYDSKGNLLYELVDPQAGRRTRVPLNQISPFLIAATLATEDQRFYEHPGFDPVGIARAVLQNIREGNTVSGASTITQQLVRALILTPEERAQRTLTRKIREAILAAEVTRTYPRDKILELYLNEIYYGNLAYGIEAAAETYFNKNAHDLTLGEASFLAGLPQGPALYDIYTDPEATYARHQQVLNLMLMLSGEVNCIPISTGDDPPPPPVCVSPDDYEKAYFAIRDYAFTPPKTAARFPHWVNYIRQILEAQYGTEIYRDGFSVTTTLDPDLQLLAEQTVASQVAALADRNVTNGALVSLKPTTGEILVMVGSDDYNDPQDGQINMALRPRQPGSSMKPLTYALAFEKGWTPATLLWDVPTDFPDGANPPYSPVNYDGRFHGPVTVRVALANSYNIPAVKALQFVGIKGTAQDAGGGQVQVTEGLIPFLEKLGVTSLTRDDYGLSLTLGGGEVPLIEMVTAYGALANNGQRVFPIAIRKITDFSGQRVICEQPLSPGEVKDNPPPCQTPPANWNQPVMRAESAYLISNILSDNDARSLSFGPNSPLRLSFDVAVKTGTTNDFKDNWTIGYTPNLVTGVWVGNADYTAMNHSTGVTGAAPIWHDFMEGALGSGGALPFTRPPNIIERLICKISGAEPGEFCPPDQQGTELFDAAHPPLPKERDLWQRAYIDPFTNLRQTADCAKFYQADRLFEQEKIVIGVADPAAQKWLAEDPNGQTWAAEHGLTQPDGRPIVWAPTADCTADSPHPITSFAYPAEGTVLNGAPVQILGQAAATADFDHFIIEYGLSHDPGGWGMLLGPNTNPFPETGKLADWDLAAYPDGPITLRIIVFSKAGGSAEWRVRLTIERPTATPAPSTATPSLTPTNVGRATLTPSLTPTPTLTPPFTLTPTAPFTPTSTNTPSETPTAAPPTDTPPPTATETPTETPTP